MKLNPWIRTIVPLHRSRANREKSRKHVPRFLRANNPSSAIRANQASAAQKSPDCFLIPPVLGRFLGLGTVASEVVCPARGSWTPPSRGGCATSRGATDSRGVPRAGVLFVASSRLGGRPRRSARDGRLASRRGPPVRPPVRVSWFSPGVTMARASALAALLAATLSAATAQDISAQGGMYYPYGSAVGPFYGCARARATATTPSLVDSETHATRPSAPLRVAAPDPWASSAPSAASASSDTPPQ